MIVEALKFLTDLARKADDGREILADDPRIKRILIGGELKEIPIARKPRRHALDSLDDVVKMVRRFMEPDGEAAVWIDESNVAVVLDDSNHRVETATLALEKSDTFRLLESLRQSKAWHEHKPFVRLLRVDLAGTGDDVSRLLETVRKVQFENGVVTASKLGRADESLGRTITSKVEAAAVLPDEVTVYAPVYKTAGERERYGVRCSLDVEPALGKFQLIPIADELERIVQAHLASIRERIEVGLDEVEVPVYYGRP